MANTSHQTGNHPRLTAFSEEDFIPCSETDKKAKPWSPMFLLSTVSTDFSALKLFMFHFLFVLYALCCLCSKLLIEEQSHRLLCEHSCEVQHCKQTIPLLKHIPKPY